MKSFPPMLIAASIIIICVFNIGLVSALSSDEAVVSPVWSTQTFNAGETVSVRLVFKSNCSDDLTVYYVGIHFDWMAADSFYGLDLSADPVVVPSYGSHTFDTMVINIPEATSSGSHSYFIGMDGTQGEYGVNFSWNSKTFMLQITNSNEEEFNELLLEVGANITNAVNASYQSAEAQSFLEQAETEYNQTQLLASQGNWEEAASSLQLVTSYLEQAEAAEQSAEQQSLVLVAAVIVVIIAISIVAVMVRKKRKKSDSAS